jgi:hypothetical protein
MRSPTTSGYCHICKTCGRRIHDGIRSAERFLCRNCRLELKEFKPLQLYLVKNIFKNRLVAEPVLKEVSSK